MVVKYTGIGWIILHLHAQAANVHIHNLVITKVVVAPYGLENIRAGQRSIGVLKEIFNDLELYLGQLNVEPFLDRVRLRRLSSNSSSTTVSPVVSFLRKPRVISTRR